MNLHASQVEVPHDDAFGTGLAPDPSRPHLRDRMRRTLVASFDSLLFSLLWFEVDSLAAQPPRTVARTDAEQEACRRWPLRLQTYGPHGDSYVHQDPVSGGSCLIPPPPPQPFAVIQNGRLFCPSADSTSWERGPRGWKRPKFERILRIEPTRDSIALAGLACDIRPRGLLRVYLKPGRARRSGRDAA